MSIEINKGKKFWEIDLSGAGASEVFELEDDLIILVLRLTGIADGDHMNFYEVSGDNPRIFQLDYNKPATMYHGKTGWRLGFDMSDCSIADPSSAILSLEVG